MVSDGISTWIYWTKISNTKGKIKHIICHKHLPDVFSMANNLGGAMQTHNHLFEYKNDAQKMRPINSMSASPFRCSQDDPISHVEDAHCLLTMRTLN